MKTYAKLKRRQTIKGVLRELILLGILAILLFITVQLS